MRRHLAQIFEGLLLSSEWFGTTGLDPSCCNRLEQPFFLCWARYRTNRLYFTYKVHHLDHSCIVLFMDASLAIPSELIIDDNGYACMHSWSWQERQAIEDLCMTCFKKTITSVQYIELIELLAPWMFVRPWVKIKSFYFSSWYFWLGWVRTQPFNNINY